MLWLEVTNFCNLTCSHCYNASGPHEPREPAIRLERYLELIEEGRNVGFRTIQFIGGEPLLYIHCNKLVQKAINTGYENIEIFSNLNFVPPWLKEQALTEKITLATSVYSSNPEVHDAITGTRGSFQRTIKAIQTLSALGFRLRAGFIEMEINKGDFLRTREYLLDIGVTSIGGDRARHFGRLEDNGGPSLSELCGNCGRGNLCVSHTGKVSPCIMSKAWSIGDASESSLVDIYQSRALEEFRDKLDTELETMCSPNFNCFPDTCAPGCNPDHCSPNCAPSCYPQNSPCYPCAPNAASPCFPNGRCGPTG